MDLYENRTGDLGISAESALMDTYEDLRDLCHITNPGYEDGPPRSGPHLASGHLPRHHHLRRPQGGHRPGVPGGGHQGGGLHGNHEHYGGKPDLPGVVGQEAPQP